MDSFNISISRDGIDDLEALGEVGLKKEESVLEEIFANPTEIYPQLSLDRNFLRLY